VLETTETWATAIAFYEASGFRHFAQRDGDIYFEQHLAEPGVRLTGQAG
jgi:hypothetical protein